MPRIGSLMLAAALGGACTSATGPEGDHPLQVQVRVVEAPTASAGLALAPGIESMQVEGAVLVLGGLKLETAGLDQTVDWTLSESVVLTLALAGQPTLAFDVDVPPGTYKELEISVDKLEVGHSQEQALIALWPALADASILVTGTLVRNGVPEAFSFSAALDIDLELLFPTPLVVTAEDAEPTLITMTLDLSQWFRGTAGAILDPSDPADRSAIESSIAASIEVLKES